MSAPAKAAKIALAKSVNKKSQPNSKKHKGHVAAVPPQKMIAPPADGENNLTVYIVPDAQGFPEIEDEHFAALRELAGQFLAAQRAAKEARAVADAAQERILEHLGGQTTVQVGPWRICRADGKPKITVTEVAQ